MEFEKIVHLEKEGTLSKYINYRDKRELKSLKITGEFANTDKALGIQHESKIYHFKKSPYILR